MTARAAHNLDPDAALDGDAGLRAAMDLHALAVAGLSAGPEARRAALDVLRWLDGDEGSLDATLGLAAPGRTHARQRLRQMHRDAALRALARAHWPDLGPTAAARVLATHWARYEASAWRRHRDAGTEPTDGLEATLHRLMLARHEPLASERLRKILSATGHFPPVEVTKQTADLE